MDSVKKYLERSDKIKAQEELEGITVSQTVEIKQYVKERSD